MPWPRTGRNDSKHSLPHQNDSSAPRRQFIAHSLTGPHQWIEHTVENGTVLKAQLQARDGALLCAIDECEGCAEGSSALMLTVGSDQELLGSARTKSWVSSPDRAKLANIIA